MHQQRPAQQRAAIRLLSTGLSTPAYVTVATIIGLENVLDQVEGFTVKFDRERGRDPGLYYLRVFGEPGGSRPWGWRFGGHHVSLNELTGDLHRRATEQNLCSQFDDFCQKHGLRRRARDYDGTISVTYQTTVTVTAADEAQARDQASSIMNDSQQFPSIIYPGNYSLSEQDWEIQDVEAS